MLGRNRIVDGESQTLATQHHAEGKARSAAGPANYTGLLREDPVERWQAELEQFVTGTRRKLERLAQVLTSSPPQPQGTDQTACLAEPTPPTFVQTAIQADTEARSPRHTVPPSYPPQLDDRSERDTAVGDSAVNDSAVKKSAAGGADTGVADAKDSDADNPLDRLAAIKRRLARQLENSEKRT